MKYYLIDHINQWLALTTVDEPSNLTEVIRYNELLDNQYKTIINQNTIIPQMDFLEVSSGKLPKNIYVKPSFLFRGIIFRNELYNSLKIKYNFAPHFYRKLTIKHKTTIIDDYCYCFFYTSINEYINIETSNFKIYSKEQTEPEIITVKSCNEINSLKHASNNHIIYNEIGLSERFPKYDIFGLFDGYSDEFYFSEKMKIEFEGMKIKEVEFKDSNILFEGSDR